MRRCAASALFACVTLVPVPALSLSCVPWGVADAYALADKSDADYVVVEGALSFDPSLAPETDWDDQRATPGHTEIPARLHGMSLTRAGFRQPFDAAVTLEITCSGPWCPSVEPGDVLAFLKREAGAYVLADNACGGLLFADPSSEDLQWVADRVAETPER